MQSRRIMLNTSNDKRFSTEPLDEAMKELLDVCKQYNEKIQDVNNSQHLNKSKMSNFTNDKFNQHVNAVTKCDSVERLQKKQCELQAQLDEVLGIAKNLEAKQQRLKLNNGSRSHRVELDDDEDSELIEFQQIENELRISELNRQLNNIQEELRLKLYNRLLSNTSNGTKSSKESSLRRNSVQTDESTPPSSSCSDEQTVSSCNSLPEAANIQRNIPDLPSALPTNHTYEVLRSTGSRAETGLPIMNKLNPPTSINEDHLERIDEGEEEETDNYANSTMFRKIYEEKLSPILQGEDRNSHSSSIDRTPESKRNNDIRFNVANVNSARRGNRPLTIYMPRPDEDIDLIEMIQNMGHDLDNISKDLRLNSTSAFGYVYKLSSNKKWLRRFFHFDRNAKKLSYYATEEQLVKNTPPKCVITFDEIGDVYVDHRSSELSEKQTGARRYVFVLSTLRRKYILSSERPETMRAWIDILYTAASNDDDYF